MSKNEIPLVVKQKIQRVLTGIEPNPYYFELELWRKSSWLAFKFMKSEGITFTDKKHNLFTNTIGYALNAKIEIEEDNFGEFKKFYEELKEPSKKKFSEIDEFDFFTKKRQVREGKK